MTVPLTEPLVSNCTRSKSHGSAKSDKADAFRVDFSDDSSQVLAELALSELKEKNLLIAVIRVWI